MADKLEISAHITEFRKRASSIMWRQETTKEHPSYDRWKARISELQAESGYSKNEAIVRASKEFAPLHQLFREYDVRKYDRDPASHPTILHYGEKRKAEVTPEKEPNVVLLGSELSYRENLMWAMEAAGAYDHTGQHPTLCPNNAAWYLYQRALADGKEFLSRVGQVEIKQLDEDERQEKRAILKEGRRSVKELDMMLQELEREVNEIADEASEPSEDRDSQSPQEA